MYKKSLEKSAKVLKKAESRDYELSLAAYKEDDTFKLFINDIGLLNYILKIRPADILDDDLSLF